MPLVYGRTSKEGEDVTITIAEAQERRLEAQRVKFESSIIEQWYYALGTTLAAQAQQGLDEPDFSSHWLRAPDGMFRYLIESGANCTIENWHEPVIDFINELIGDQLELYGIEARLHTVSGRIGNSNRFYLLKPGQEPSYNYD